uniref:Uncharacterized protein n=1 Tax=Thermodesulfobacterium geofontis TaxID=1295609 RepID=A0A7V5XFQ6_9BACT
MRVNKFLLFLLVFLLLFCFSSVNSQKVQNQAQNPESEWKFITLSETGKHEIYVNQNSIKKISENEVYAEVKFYPAKEEREKIKKEFEELEKQTQQEFGTKVEGTEKLLYEMYNLKSRYFQFKAKCNENKIEVLGKAFIKFVIEVKPDTPSEKIYQSLCQFLKENQKN